MDGERARHTVSHLLSEVYPTILKRLTIRLKRLEKSYMEGPGSVTIKQVSQRGTIAHLRASKS